MNKKDHWENIYEEKSPLNVSWYQEKPNVSLALIQKLSAKPSAFIIDVGGGASTLSACLLDMAYNNLTVLDLSANALAHVKQKMGKQADLVNWEEADVTCFTPPHQYDIWHDRAVFHFLTEKEDREKYRQSLLSATQIGSYIIIAAFSIGGPTQCSGLKIVQYDSEKIQKELAENFSLIEEVEEKHLTPAGKKQAFTYFVFLRNT